MRNLLGVQLDKNNIKAIQKDVKRTIAEPRSAQKALFAILKCLANSFPEGRSVSEMVPLGNVT